MNKLNHIAFIMDGNGRWGKKRNKSRNFGHLAGVKTVQKIVKSALKFRIPIITFYVFSTENWKRPKIETNYLFSLINTYFKKELNNVISNNIKINIIGDKKKLSPKIKSILQKVINKTQENKKLIINLAINYGSKNEIINAVIKTNRKKKLITEKNIEENETLFIN